MDQTTSEEGKVWVYWFADNKLSQVSRILCLPFMKHFHDKFKITKHQNFKKAVAAACAEYCRKTYGVMEKWVDEDYISWGTKNFPEQPTAKKETFNLQYAPYITDKLTEFAAMNSIMKKNIEVKTKKDIQRKKQVRNQALTSREGKVRKVLEKRNDKDCLRCNKSASYDHPLFEGMLCKMCMERWKLTFFSSIDHMFVHCCVCGYLAGGSVRCANKKCGRMYCDYCIQTFKIDKSGSQQWMCFLCTQTKDGLLLMKRELWKINVFNSYFLSKESEEKLPSDVFPKERITVLSLFDDSGAGFKMLQDVGITIDKYFISSLACDKNDGNIIDEKVQNLGNIDQLSPEYLEQMKDIDFIIVYITTMPSFITSTPKKKFEAPEKQVIIEELFFKFYWTYRDIVHIRRKHHVFWLFAINDAFVTIDLQKVTERYLQEEGQTEEEDNLKFWTNIPCCKPIHNSTNIFKSLSFFYK